MTMPAAPPRAYLRALAAAAFLLALAAPARADTPEAGNFDARTAEPAGSAAPAGEAARERLRDQLGRFGALTLDETTGTLRAVSRLDGYLTAPSTRSGAAVALGYVREHAAAFGLDGDDLDGLRLTGRETADRVEHLTWEQRYGGIPVADAGLEAAVTTVRAARRGDGPAGRRPRRPLARPRAERAARPTRRRAAASGRAPPASAWRTPRRAVRRRRASTTAARPRSRSTAVTTATGSPGACSRRSAPRASTTC